MPLSTIITLVTGSTLVSLAYLFYSLIPPNSHPLKQAPTLNLHSFDKHAAYRFSWPPPPPPPPLHLIYTKNRPLSPKMRVYTNYQHHQPMKKAKEMSTVMSLGPQICFFFISFSFLLTKNLDTIWAIDYDNDGMAGRGSTEWQGMREYEATTRGAQDASASRAPKPIFSTLSPSTSTPKPRQRAQWPPNRLPPLCPMTQNNHLNAPNHIKMAVAARAWDTACFKP